MMHDGGARYESQVMSWRCIPDRETTVFASVDAYGSLQENIVAESTAPISCGIAALSLQRLHSFLPITFPRKRAVEM